MERIQYREPNYAAGVMDNSAEVVKFIGRENLYDCPKCHELGEYDTECGPRGCQLCNSRLIAFNGKNGVEFADWGDWIERNETGKCTIVHE